MNSWSSLTFLYNIVNNICMGEKGNSICSSEHCLNFKLKYSEIYLNLSWHIIAISFHFIFVFTNSFNLHFRLYLCNDNTKGRNFLKMYVAAHSTFSPPDRSTPICNSVITSPVVSTLTRVNNRATLFKEWVTRHSVCTLNYVQWYLG